MDDDLIVRHIDVSLRHCYFLKSRKKNRRVCESRFVIGIDSCFVFVGGL